MKLSLEITEGDLKRLVVAHVREQLGDVALTIKDNDVRIEVKSKQNYKSEWETAAFRARVEVDR